MKELVEICSQKYPENKKKVTARILEQSIKIDVKKYNDKQCNIYITPEEEKKKEEKVEEKGEEKKDKNKKKGPVIKTTKSILERIKMLNLKTSNDFKKKGGLSEKEKDNIKEYIKDYVVKIFKSEEVNLDQKEKTELFNKLTLPFGRDFFISLISKNTSNVILLKPDSFHLLGNIIYNCILETLKLEETSKILENIVLLIKSTNYFGINENGTVETMFQKYKQKIPLPKITQQNLWDTWFEVELKKKENPKDEDKQEIIYGICKNLIDFELPKSMIKKITDNINIKIFGKGTEKQKETFDVFIKFIINAKYVSQII